MPVTHGYENMRVERIAQFAFEPAGLKFRQLAEGRPAANLGIVFLDSPGTPRRNKSSQRLAGQLSKREVDDIRITEEVIEERLDRLKGVRPAQLKEDYPDPTSTFCLSWTHFALLVPAL